MNRTDIETQLETIQGCIETLDTVYRNFEDFGGSVDMCSRDSLCEITFIVQAQQKIIKGLVEAISISPEEQTYKIKIKDCSMSPRLQTVLYNLGFEYIDEAYDLWIREGDWGLLKVHYNFGRKSLNELKDIFGELDWHMAQQESKNHGE